MILHLSPFSIAHALLMATSLGLCTHSERGGARAQALPQPPDSPTQLPASPGKSAPNAPGGAAVPLPLTNQLRARLEGLEKQLRDKAIPADPQNQALLRFKLEQCRLLLSYLDDGLAAYPELAQRALSSYLGRTEVVARATGDAVYPAAIPFHERAYIAANDDSPQPFWVFVPDDYSARHNYPLVIMLHGYTPTITKVDPWLPDETTWRAATSRGFILALPYGRRNSDFVDAGEDDVLQVLEEVKKKYPIDPSRIFLMGPSMGGFGTYTVGLHRPDLWTAIAPMSARSDFYLWFKLNRDEVPDWKRLQYDADDPRFLKRNAQHLPIFLQHGALDDIVPVEHSRRLNDDLKALGYPMRYREIEDGDHFIYFEADPYNRIFEWMRPQRRTSMPRRVHYTSGNARNDKAYWLQIGAREDYSRAANIEAEIKEGNRIEVKIENVEAFTLSPPANVLDAKKPVSLFVNGQAVQMPFEAQKPITWRSTALQSTLAKLKWPGEKTPLRSGPIKNVYRDPFLLVFGTKTVPGGANADAAQARLWQREWQAYADGLPPIKADVAVTEDDRKNYNLVLFGTRESNALLAQIADRLPIELTANGYRWGEKQIAGTNLGLQMCYASPFDARRLIVVQSGQAWGRELPINHKFDLLPDFIVFDSTLDPTDKTNRAIAAGFFTHTWELPSKEPPAAQEIPQALLNQAALSQALPAQQSPTVEQNVKP
ncbi:MAG: hypothetical protein JWN98_876 [Abditibacteriota bacterium]|nr:hypothetical protein [Abditibacteriota bacterium]